MMIIPNGKWTIPGGMGHIPARKLNIPVGMRKIPHDYKIFAKCEEKKGIA
jgi:hypothetical protein